VKYEPHFINKFGEIELGLKSNYNDI